MNDEDKTTSSNLDEAANLIFPTDSPIEITSKKVTYPIELFTSTDYRNLRFRPQLEPLAWYQSSDIITENCFVRGIFSGVAGYGLGLLMGGFFHTMGPMNHVDDTAPLWTQMKQSYKGFGESCLRMAKGFAKLGLLYSTIECLIEKERGSHDIPNAVYGGCVTGGLLAFQAGPLGMGAGCLGFAAFSGIIEVVMRS